MNSNTVTGKATDKTIRVHSLVISAVCILMGIMSLLKASYIVGAGSITMAVLIPLISLAAMKNIAVNTRGVFLTQMTVVVIALLAGGSATLYSMVTILLANIGIASIYYDPKNIKATWIFTNVLLIISIFFREAVYGVGIDMVYIIKGLIGVNVGAFMIYLLMKNSIDLIIQAKEETDHVESLMEEVHVKMTESQALSAEQREIMNDVAESAGHLESTSGLMLEISSRLTEASENQARTMDDIHTNVDQFTLHTEECHNVAEQASQAAVQSVQMINENNQNMENMVHAIQELEETSNRIGGIIKTIDDISFQTNILALNAAVEAARAGDAGKGFAVVADEVRNLAGKSAEAAKVTAQLINESIEGVQRSAKIVQDATDQMTAVLECSRLSEDYARQINDLMGQQQDAITEIQSSIVAVSDIISANTQTATESADVARSVLSEVEHMNKMVTSHHYEN